MNNNHGIHATGTADISVSNCLLENNAYGVRATGGTLAFLNDRVINNTSFGIYLDGAAPTFGSSLAEWNDIHDNGTGQPGRDLRNGPTDIEARFVHWGSMDHGEILTRIWDRRDDLELGYVQILAFVNAAHDGEITGVDDPLQGQNLPVAFNLGQNAPNPFNPSTVIRFDLPGSVPVNLKVYDVSGSLVATLVDDQLPAGKSPGGLAWARPSGAVGALGHVYLSHRRRAECRNPADDARQITRDPDFRPGLVPFLHLTLFYRYRVFRVPQLPSSLATSPVHSARTLSMHATQALFAGSTSRQIWITCSPQGTT